MPPINQRIQEFPLTFEGGLVTEVEDSTLEVGQAASLVNWVPTAQGGLRARNAWSAISTDGLVIAADGLPGDYKVRGWGSAAISAAGGSSGSSVVQTTHLVSIGLNSGEVSLSGVTVGNTLVLVSLAANTSGEPTITSGSGWTARTISGVLLNYPDTIRLFTKTADSTSETVELTLNSGSLDGLFMLELSGVTTEAPFSTDADDTTAAAAITLTGSSAALSGVAITAWDSQADAWTTEATADGYTSIAATTDTYTAEAYYKVFSATATPDVDVDLAGSTADGVGILATWEESSAIAATPAEFILLLAVATDTGYSVYKINRSEIQAGTWTLIDSATCDDTSGFVSMSVGAGTLVWSSSTMDVPRSVVLSTSSAADVTDLDGKAGRAVVYHKDRMFVAGETDAPSRAYFSDIGDPTSFTIATDFLDVGGDDGEAIEDLVSVEGLLLVCKTNRLYLISGSGIESFITNELPGGSAATGRPAVRTPYGTVVVGPTDVWVVQGGGVDPMSRSLGEDFAITGLVSTAYAQDMVLVCDSGSGNVYRVNLVTGAWQLEEVTEGENEPGHVFSLQGRLYYGVTNSATQVGGTRRLSSARDYDFTGGMSFEASTGKLALLGPSITYTPRFLYLQLRNHDTTKPNSVFVTVTTDIGEEEQGFMVTEEVQRERLDLGRYRGAAWIQIGYHSDSSAIAGAIDIEKAVLGAIVDGGH